MKYFKLNEYIPLKNLVGGKLIQEGIVTSSWKYSMSKSSLGNGAMLGILSMCETSFIQYVNQSHPTEMLWQSRTGENQRCFLPCWMHRFVDDFLLTTLKTNTARKDNTNKQIGINKLRSLFWYSVADSPTLSVNKKIQFIILHITCWIKPKHLDLINLGEKPISTILAVAAVLYAAVLSRSAKGCGKTNGTAKTMCPDIWLTPTNAWTNWS